MFAGVVGVIMVNQDRRFETIVKSFLIESALVYLNHFLQRKEGAETFAPTIQLLGNSEESLNYYYKNFNDREGLEPPFPPNVIAFTFTHRAYMNN